MSKVIPLSVPHLWGDEWKQVKQCFESGWVSTAGPDVEKFEQKICKALNVKYAVACNSGTSALHIALLVAGVKPNDEIIVPTVTFVAPINVVHYCRAIPVFMDCDQFYNLDVEKTIQFIKQETVYKRGCTFNKKSKRKISALIPVHVFGNAVDLKRLIALCKQRNIKIIEDATESLGTKYCSGTLKGKMAGAVGDIGCLSFNGNKMITAGGGGMLVTNHKKMFEHAKYLSTTAKDDGIYFRHDEIGFNYRLNNIQAAFGVSQLKHLKDVLRVKKKNYERYREEINAIDGLTLAEVPDYATNNHWLYAIKINRRQYGKSRDQLLQLFFKNRIMARPLWMLNHKQKSFKRFQSFLIEKAKELYQNTINIPSSYNLTHQEMKRVVKILKAALL